MSTDNRMVSIVDDDPDITLLFHEVLKLSWEYLFLLLQILF